MTEAISLGEDSFYELASAGDDEVLEALSKLSQHKLGRLRKLAGQTIENKYERGRGKPKYGNLPRCFTKRQLLKFFSHIKNPRIYWVLLLLFAYGLRVGENSHVRVVPGQNMLAVKTFKPTERTEYLPIYEATEPILSRLKEIQGLSTGYIQKCFRKIRADAGEEFEYVYDYTKHTIPKPLYQFTAHTMRHTAGNMLMHKTSNPYKETKFLRHCGKNKFGVTVVYMHYDHEEMRKDLQETFGETINILVSKAPIWIQEH